MAESREFKVPLRFLIMSLVGGNLGIFVLTPLLVKGFPPETLMTVAIVFNLIHIIGWKKGSYNFCSIKVSDTEIEGPSPDRSIQPKLGAKRSRWMLPRIAIALSDIDRSRTGERSALARFYRWTDVWATDGRRIRLYHALLGGDQVTQIKNRLLK